MSSTPGITTHLPRLRYGLKKDLRAHVEPVFKAPLTADILPKKATLIKPLMSDVLNQGISSACVACAVINTVRFCLKKTGIGMEPLSILYLYFNARAMAVTNVGNATTNLIDDGCTIHDCFQSIKSTGLARDVVWPYSDSKINTKPSLESFTDAITQKHLFDPLNFYQVAQDLTSIRICIALQIPVIAGFTVYQSFEDTNTIQTGQVTMPTAHDIPIGHHCVILTGYDDWLRTFSFQTSWGTTWGGPERGYGTIPYSYVLDDRFTPELWTLTAAEEQETSIETMAAVNTAGALAGTISLRSDQTKQPKDQRTPKGP